MQRIRVGVLIPGRAVTWIMLVVLLVFASEAVASSVLTGPKRGSVTSSSMQARSSTERALDQLAVNMAASAGNALPSAATWIETTRVKAMAFMDSAPSDQAAANPVWIMVVQGGRFLRPPRDSCPPGLRGRCNLPPFFAVIVAIVDQPTGDVTDFGETDRAPNLSSIGRPETDSLVGIKPTVPVR